MLWGWGMTFFHWITMFSSKTFSVLLVSLFQIMMLHCQKQGTLLPSTYWSGTDCCSSTNPLVKFVIDFYVFKDKWWKRANPSGREYIFENYGIMIIESRTVMSLFLFLTKINILWHDLSIRAAWKLTGSLVRDLNLRTKFKHHL